MKSNKYRNLKVYFRLLCFILLGCSFSLKAEESNNFNLTYPYINYTTKDGLPSNETYCVFQDSRGFIWIGTDRGLVKFDGYEFETYTTLDGLNDNVILAINEDIKGNIWYTGLNNFSLGYIDPQMKFHDYLHHQEYIDAMRNFNGGRLHFNEIYIDGEDIYAVCNRLGYIAFNDKGIKELNVRILNEPETGKVFLHFNEKSKFVYANYKSNLIENVNVDVFDEYHRYMGRYQKKQFDKIYPSMLYKDSCTYVYDGDQFFTVKGKEFYHEELNVNCFVNQLSDNQFLYSTYNPQTKLGVVYYSNSPNFNHPKVKIKEGVNFSNSTLDSRGGIWISTINNGLLYIPTLSSKLSVIKDPIKALFPFKEGFQLNTVDKRFQFNAITGQMHEINKPNTYRDLTYFERTHFTGFAQVKFHIDDINHRDYHIGRSIKGWQTLGDSLQYYWTPGYLYKFKNNELTYRRFWKDGVGNVELSYQNAVYCFKEDSCLYATQLGLYIYDKDSVINLNEEEGKSIRLIEYFKEQNVLVYSILGEGLVLKYPNGNKIQLVKSKGLISNVINSLYMDSSGVLWIGTNQGLNKLTLKENQTYLLETLLQGSKQLSSPNILQIYKQNHLLYLGTDAGLNVVDLKYESNLKNIGRIPLRLTQIDINNILFEKSFENELLDYDRNNITFHYSAIAFNLYGQVNYRYKLNGFSDEWVYTKERKASFLQLPSGDYQFELEVQDEQGSWFKLDYKPSFIINKPYWETWWFRLITLGLIGAFGYYHISNLKKERAYLKRENLYVENERLLSEELNESRQKALSAQLNPHFVFNSLNSIQNFILTRRTELSSDYLSTFSKLMRFVFENSKKLYVSLADEVEALKLYLELEEVRHNHKFTYELVSDKSLNLNTILVPSLLIQPIIENAIWHGLLHKNSNDRRLEIRFKMVEDFLHIEIEDNGVGRELSKPKVKFIKKQKSSGVELTKQRLDLLSQSTGLKTSFEIEDLYDDTGNPRGTKVKIVIPSQL